MKTIRELIESGTISMNTKVIGTFPMTADGCVVGNDYGSSVICECCGQETTTAAKLYHPEFPGKYAELHGGWLFIGNTDRPVNQFYSTHTAAAAASANKHPQQNTPLKSIPKVNSNEDVELISLRKRVLELEEKLAALESKACRYDRVVESTKKIASPIRDIILRLEERCTSGNYMHLIRNATGILGSLTKKLENIDADIKKGD